jgi:apolipoprotein N-acyltransferase
VGKPAGGQRLVRTIVFGAVAVVAAILWVARELDLDRQELLGFAATSLALVGLFAVLGLVAGVLFWLVRRARLRRGR